MTDAFMGAVIGITLFIIICLIWTKYSKPHVEGFVSGGNPKDIVSKIKSTTNNLSDKLNKTKYRNEYEDIISESETWATESQMQLLMRGKIGIGPLTESIEDVRRFNDLKVFRSNLAEMMNILDAT
jgi:hypothetical protein